GTEQRRVRHLRGAAAQCREKRRKIDPIRLNLCCIEARASELMHDQHGSLRAVTTSLEHRARSGRKKLIPQVCVWERFGIGIDAEDDPYELLRSSHCPGVPASAFRSPQVLARELAERLICLC